MTGAGLERRLLRDRPVRPGRYHVTREPDGPADSYPWKIWGFKLGGRRLINSAAHFEVAVQRAGVLSDMRAGVL